MANDLFYFLRKQEVDLLRYLPPFLSKDESFKQVEDTLSREHENLRAKLVDFAKQFFIETASWSVKDWEEFVGVVKLTDDLEARRARVKAKLLGSDVMTVDNVNKLIRSFTDGIASFVEETSEPNVIKINLLDKLLYWQEFIAALKELLPAHLGMRFERQRREYAEVTAGVVEARSGYKRLKLPTPPNGRMKLNAGVALFKTGYKDAAGLATPIIMYGNEPRLRVGLASVKSGLKVIGADLSDLEHILNIKETAVADILIADVGIARPTGINPSDAVVSAGEIGLHVGTTLFKTGNKSIGLTAPAIGYRNQITTRFGIATSRSGLRTVSADLSDLDRIKAIKECAITDALVADIGIARPSGIIIIEPEPEPEDFAVEDGEWIRIYFDFPTSRDKPVLLMNPREDLIVGDVQDLGEMAASKGIFLSSKAENTLGIREVDLIRGFDINEADDLSLLPSSGVLRLFFYFPSGNDHKVLLHNLRGGVTIGEIKKLGRQTAAARLLVNARGEHVQGLKHAAVIRNFAIREADRDNLLKF